MLTQEEKNFIEMLAKAPVPKSIAELRAMMDGFTPMMNQNPPEIGALHEDVELRSGLRADIAVPKGAGPHPVLVYLHGGGWVTGSPKTHRKLGMQFADAGYLTINVDYRLAPEHPFPAGLDDCVFAIKWAGQNAAKYKGDQKRIAVGGDSAGGNLTAASVAALGAENYSGTKPGAALLIYGLFDFPKQLEAAGDNPMILEMTRAYAGSGYPEVLKDPRVSPIFAVKPFALPPCFIICGTADPLISDSRAMAEALTRADIRHELHIYQDMPHGFLQMDVLAGCRDGFAKMVDFLKRTL
jgi:acetyl esterase